MQYKTDMDKSYKSETIKGLSCLLNRKFDISTYYRVVYRHFQRIADKPPSVK